MHGRDYRICTRKLTVLKYMKLRKNLVFHGLLVCFTGLTVLYRQEIDAATNGVFSYVKILVFGFLIIFILKKGLSVYSALRSIPTPVNDAFYFYDMLKHCREEIQNPVAATVMAYEAVMWGWVWRLSSSKPSTQVGAPRSALYILIITISFGVSLTWLLALVLPTWAVVVASVMVFFPSVWAIANFNATRFVGIDKRGDQLAIQKGLIAFVRIENRVICKRQSVKWPPASQAVDRHTFNAGSGNWCMELTLSESARTIGPYGISLPDTDTIRIFTHKDTHKEIG